MPVFQLPEQFSTIEKREHALEFGMWAFLGSEALLFAGLFALYAAYRTMYPYDFAAAAQHNKILIGTANTYVLITSSLTVALAVHAARHGYFRRLTAFLALTLGFGFVFLILKAIEYVEHFEEGIYPGRFYRFAELPSYGAKLFYTLYYIITGLHAAHVIAGMTIIAWMCFRSWRRAYTPDNHVYLEMGALYWHLVDVMWIFIWPLLYLVR